MDQMGNNAKREQTVRLRLADLADAVAITALINKAFKIVEGFFIDGDRVDQRGVEKLFKSGHFLLAERDSSLAGCVYVEMKSLLPVRSYLGLLSVTPSEQHAGIGSQLMEFAEAYCRNHNSTAMDILVVNLREELPAFYANRGYRITGSSPFPADAITKLPCYFIEMSKPL